MKLSRKNIYPHRLQCLYIEKETGNIFADTNKSAYEFDISNSESVRKAPKNIFMKIIFKWIDQLSGNFIINDQIMKKIKELHEKNKNLEYLEQGEKPLKKSGITGDIEDNMG